MLQQVLQWNKAGSAFVFRSQNLERRQIRRHLIQAFFHNGLQILSRGSTGVAGSVKPELNRSIMNADQLHLAIEFAQARLCIVERLQDTGFQIVGMERIEEKQVPDDRILAEFADDSVALLL